MTAVLAFVLECAATAALVGTAAALVCAGTLRALRPLSLRWAPAHRADVHVVLGVVPALAALATVVSAALPPVAAAVGLGQDHCLSHAHHLHLCLVHAAGLRPSLAVLGALALAVFAFRLGHLVSRTASVRARVAALVSLGTGRVGRAFPVVTVPGRARLCHAAGIFRRRVLVSEALASALAPRSLDAALAHEEAHLTRRDPLVGLLLSVSGLFAPPPFVTHVVDGYRRAAEEACDAEAARVVGDGAQVAEALVQVAALQRGPPHTLAGAAAFGQVALERRVRLLLEGPGAPGGPGRALPLAGAAGVLAVVLALSHAAALHHAVETLLHHLS